MKRLLANLILLGSLFLLPFWCTAILAILVSLYFDFIEIIFYGFIFDLLFGIKSGFFENHIFTVSAVVMYGIILLIKPYIKI